MKHNNDVRKHNHTTNYCPCCGSDMPLHFKKEIQHGCCSGCGWDFHYHLNEDDLCCFLVDQDFMTELLLISSGVC